MLLMLLWRRHLAAGAVAAGAGLAADERLPRADALLVQRHYRTLADRFGCFVGPRRHRQLPPSHAHARTFGDDVEPRGGPRGGGGKVAPEYAGQSVQQTEGAHRLLTRYHAEAAASRQTQSMD